MSEIKKFFDGFILCLSFFTQFPSPYYVKSITQERYKYMILSLPLIGLILGSVVVLFFIFISPYVKDCYIAIYSSIFYLFLYGFLHLEAVVDIVDGYYAKHNGKDAYKVVKDSHVGALGVIGIISFIILKVTSLSYLLVNHKYVEIILIISISRVMALYFIYFFDFHKESKFIYSLKQSLDDKTMIIYTIIFSLIMLIFNMFVLFIVASIFTIFIQKWLMKNIGFLNGDGVGFLIELQELILFNIMIFI